MVRLFFLLLCVVCALPVSAKTTLRVYQSEHPLDAYAIGVLELALQKSGKAYSVQVQQRTVTQERARIALHNGDIDVVWYATKALYERDLVPVRFPILKGALGYRLLVIRREDQPLFDEVRALDDLRSVILGQAAVWPDTQVLRHNGLQVVASSNYASLFRMLETHRFDAFPRGLVEPWIELEGDGHPDLAVEDGLLLSYVMPFYLFVAPQNAQLAADIETGLEVALADGSFDRYFYGQDMVVRALAESRLSQRRVIRLRNPQLDELTPLDRPELWLDARKLGLAEE